MTEPDQRWVLSVQIDSIEDGRPTVNFADLLVGTREECNDQLCYLHDVLVQPVDKFTLLAMVDDQLLSVRTNLIRTLTVTRLAEPTIELPDHYAVDGFNPNEDENKVPAHPAEMEFEREVPSELKGISFKFAAPHDAWSSQ